MSDVASALGLIVTGATPVWTPLVIGDFVSAGAADFDPNGIMDAPLAVAAGGIVTIRTTEQGVMRDGAAEGATHWLNWPTAWVGDGQWAVIYRLTPITHPGVAIVCFALGFCDRNANPTNAAALVNGYGVRTPTAALIDGVQTARTLGAAFGTDVALAATPATLVRWLPAGIVGDEANVGAQPGLWGSQIATFRSAPAVPDFTHATYRDGVVTDGIRPCLFTTWMSVGADLAVWQVRVEWAVVPAWPVGEFL